MQLRLWRMAFVGCLLSVLMLSLLPSSASVPFDTGWDKANHVLAFFVLSQLSQMAFPGMPWRIAVGLLGYGVLIEGLQSLTMDRTADWSDVLADLVGILVPIRRH